MADIEKAKAELRRAIVAFSTSGALTLKGEQLHADIVSALSALDEEKEPEVEVWWKERMGSTGHAWRIWAPTNDPATSHYCVASYVNDEDAERLLKLPALERSHEALMSAAKRVVDEYWRVTFGQTDSVERERNAVAALEELLERKS